MAVKSIVTGTTNKLKVTVTVDGTPPDLTLDTVTFTLKRRPDDPDSQAGIQVDADVSTYGAIGIAIITLTPTITNKKAGKYPYDIIWYLANGTDEYSLTQSTLSILERVSDP